MVLMRARESFEDLEKRYNTRLANTGTKKGIAAIMSCHREVCETDGSHEGNDEVTHEVDWEAKLESRGKEGKTEPSGLEPFRRKGRWL